ncbi:MAG TPA: hypothetical protein VNI83_09250 [Vicinamibacterales bacterium]|nr:hypothetical protein [Vicinamibacterales bacterium]
MPRPDDAPAAARPRRPLVLDEDLAFQRRVWTIQRIGWVVLALLVVAGAFGLFGGGPISRASTGDPAGRLAVEYERFCRREATTTLTVRLREPRAPEGAASVVFAPAYLDAIAIEQVVPPPEGSEIRPDGVVFRFRPPPNDMPMVVIFFLRVRRAGIVFGRLSSAGSSVTFRQLVYP